MKNLKVISNPDVQEVFSKYPEHVRNQMLKLRNLVLESAQEIEEISEIEETLKWGEPSYLVKKGSTLRMDWKEKTPDQYAVYFKCTSKLVETFQSVFGNKFKYEGTRAILFDLDEKIPEQPLKTCMKVALTYHRVKHLENLGIENSAQHSN